MLLWRAGSLVLGLPCLMWLAATPAMAVVLASPFAPTLGLAPLLHPHTLLQPCHRARVTSAVRSATAPLAMRTYRGGLPGRTGETWWVPTPLPAVLLTCRLVSPDLEVGRPRAIKRSASARLMSALA